MLIVPSLDTGLDKSLAITKQKKTVHFRQTKTLFGAFGTYQWAKRFSLALAPTKLRAVYCNFEGRDQCATLNHMNALLLLARP